MNTENRFLRPAEAASFLGVSQATLFRWAAAGRVKRVKLGPRTSAFRLSDLNALANAEDEAEEVEEATEFEVADEDRDESAAVEGVAK